MADTITPPARFPRLRWQVSAFVLIALFAVVALIVLVAFRQGWFVAHTSIYFVAVDALGINKGMPVKLHGFTIGSVLDLTLAAQGGVDVRLAIMRKYMPRIPKGSHARFARESGVIGSSVIEIVPAAPVGGKNQPLGDDDRIEFERSRGISEIVEDFLRQAAPALAQINRSSEDLAKTLAVIRAEAERLPETHDALRRALTSADRATWSIGQQATATLTEVGQRATTTLDSARRAADSLDREIPVIASKLSTTLDSIGAAATQVRHTGAGAQDTLHRAGTLMDQGEATARDAGEVVGAAKRVWPLSGAFRDAPDSTLPIDSFEARPATAPR